MNDMDQVLERFTKIPQALPHPEQEQRKSVFFFINLQNIYKFIY